MTNPGHRPNKVVPSPRPDSLHYLANIVLAMSYLIGAASVVACIGLCAKSSTTYDALGPDTTNHPFVGLGIAIGAAGLIQALVVGLLATWAKLYAEVQSAILITPYATRYQPPPASPWAL